MITSENPEIWLRRFMKEHNVDSVRDPYLEGLQFTKEEATGRVIEIPSLVYQNKRRNICTYSKKLGTTPQRTERRILQFRKQSDSTTSPWSSDHNTF